MSLKLAPKEVVNSMTYLIATIKMRQYENKIESVVGLLNQKTLHHYKQPMLLPMNFSNPSTII